MSSVRSGIPLPNPVVGMEQSVMEIENGSVWGVGGWVDGWVDGWMDGWRRRGERRRGTYFAVDEAFLVEKDADLDALGGADKEGGELGGDEFCQSSFCLYAVRHKHMEQLLGFVSSSSHCVLNQRQRDPSWVVAAAQRTMPRHRRGIGLISGSWLWVFHRFFSSFVFARLLLFVTCCGQKESVNSVDTVHSSLFVWARWLWLCTTRTWSLCLGQTTLWKG